MKKMNGERFIKLPLNTLLVHRNNSNLLKIKHDMFGMTKLQGYNELNLCREDFVEHMFARMLLPSFKCAPNFINKYFMIPLNKLEE